MDSKETVEVLRMKVEALEREVVESRHLLRESREAVISLRERLQAMERMTLASQRLVILLIVNVIAIMVHIAIAVAGWIR